MATTALVFILVSILLLSLGCGVGSLLSVYAGRIRTWFSCRSSRGGIGGGTSRHSIARGGTSRQESSCGGENRGGTSRRVCSCGGEQRGGSSRRAKSFGGGTSRRVVAIGGGASRQVKVGRNRRIRCLLAVMMIICTLHLMAIRSIGHDRQGNNEEARGWSRTNPSEHLKVNVVRHRTSRLLQRAQEKELQLSGLAIQCKSISIRRLAAWIVIGYPLWTQQQHRIEMRGLEQLQEKERHGRRRQATDLEQKNGLQTAEMRRLPRQPTWALLICLSVAAWLSMLINLLRRTFRLFRLACPRGKIRFRRAVKDRRLPRAPRSQLTRRQANWTLGSRASTGQSSPNPLSIPCCPQPCRARKAALPGRCSAAKRPIRLAADMV